MRGIKQRERRELLCVKMFDAGLGEIDGGIYLLARNGTPVRRIADIWDCPFLDDYVDIGLGEVADLVDDLLELVRLTEPKEPLRVRPSGLN